MALSVHADGSQTATISTEHSLVTSPETTAGVFQLFVDVNAMVNGDTLVLRIYEKTRAADTQRVLEEFTLANVQLRKLWAAPALHLRAGWNMTLTQTTGTGRAFPWSIRKAA